MLGHNVFNDFWRSGRGPHHLPFPQKNNGNHSVFNDFAGGVGPSRHLSPRQKNYRNQQVFNDLKALGGAPVAPHRSKKLWKSWCFQWFSKWGGGSCHLPNPKKNSGNLHVWMILGDRGLLAVWTHAFPQVSGGLLCGLRTYSTIWKSKKTNGFENLKIWIDLYGFGWERAEPTAA